MSKRILKNVLRIFLVLLTLGVIGWIFSNSMQNAEESSAVSGGVTDVIQEVVDTIVGEDKITVTGHFVRKTAHFTEYAILGTCLFLTYLSFTTRKRFYFIPMIVVVAIPIIDELIQTTSDGRACSPLDMLLDLGGGCFGMLVTFAITMLVIHIYKTIKTRQSNKTNTRT